MEELANLHNKSLGTLFHLVSQETSSPRLPNTWNIFQPWYGLNGEYSKSKDGMLSILLATSTVSLLMSTIIDSNDDWIKFVRSQYDELLDTLGEDREDETARAELFEPIIDWYKERLGAYVKISRDKNKFHISMSKIARKFTNLVCLFLFVLIALNSS